MFSSLHSLIVIAFVFALQGHSFAQTRHNHENDYAAIFKVETINEGQYQTFSTTVANLDPQHRLSDLVNNNKLFLEYLLLNHSQARGSDFLTQFNQHPDPQTHLLETLNKDSAFANLFDELVGHFTAIQESGTQQQKPSVSWNAVLDVASRFFWIAKISKSGKYLGRMCIGTGGLEHMSQRQPYLEAFCYAAILENATQGNQELLRVFQQALNKLNQEDTGSAQKTDKQLHRAQNAMLKHMKESQTLQDVLLQAYQEHEKYMPFVLVKD